MDSGAQDGSVYTFGRNVEGQLGLGHHHLSVSSPQRVVALGEANAQVIAGGFHTLILTAAGGVASFGRNLNGQLGVGALSCPYCATTPSRENAATHQRTY